MKKNKLGCPPPAELSGQENITDDDWHAICAIIPLPKEARLEIDAKIGLYRLWETAKGKPSTQVRKTLQRASRTASELTASIKDLGKPEWRQLDLLKPKHVERSAIEFLSTVQDQIIILNEWCLASAMQIKRKRKTSTFPLRDFVQTLDDELLKHTGRNIKRSKKRTTDQSERFVHMMCNVANPHLGPGSVDEAMKSIIKSRRSSER